MKVYPAHQQTKSMMWGVDPPDLRIIPAQLSVKTINDVWYAAASGTFESVAHTHETVRELISFECFDGRVVFRNSNSDTDQGHVVAQRSIRKLDYVESCMYQAYSIDYSSAQSSQPWDYCYETRPEFEDVGFERLNTPIVSLTVYSGIAGYVSDHEFDVLDLITIRPSRGPRALPDLRVGVAGNGYIGIRVSAKVDIERYPPDRVALYLDNLSNQT